MTLPDWCYKLIQSHIVVYMFFGNITTQRRCEKRLQLSNTATGAATTTIERHPIITKAHCDSTTPNVTQMMFAFPVSQLQCRVIEFRRHFHRDSGARTRWLIIPSVCNCTTCVNGRANGRVYNFLKTLCDRVAFKRESQLAQRQQMC